MYTKIIYIHIVGKRLLHPIFFNICTWCTLYWFGRTYRAHFKECSVWWLSIFVKFTVLLPFLWNHGYWKSYKMSSDYFHLPFLRAFDIGIDTKIWVIVLSPTTWRAHHSPRAKPEVCGELPRSLVTPQWPKSYQFIFYHDASKHIKSSVYKRKIAHKTVSNQPLWKEWPQTIVTTASLVTSWLPLWCHSDDCVTKSWQYASLKN